RSGRRPLQAERLSWEGGAALLLATALNDLTGQLAPRAVARDTIASQAIRPDRRQRKRPGVEDPEGRDGPGEDELAVVRVPGSDQREVKPEHAGLLRSRREGRNPPQMGRPPRRACDRHGAGEADHRDGGEWREAAK